MSPRIDRPQPLPIKARKKGTSEPFRSAVLVIGHYTDGSDAVRFRNTVTFCPAEEYEIRREPCAN